MIFIKMLRKKKGLTQAQLADAIGVRQSTVAMWESGSNTPQTAMLPQIASALGCEIADLFKTDTSTELIP